MFGKKEIKIAHLLLAAGASTRMGQPKQLMTWKGRSLIQHAINTILESEVAEKLIVVLGANQSLIVPELEDLEVEIVINPDWEEGMGSTIRCGLQYLLENKSEDWAGIGISLVDQPLVSARHFQILYQEWHQNEHPIAAAHYNQILGVPAIFERSLFPKLLALKGPAGARKILMQHQEKILPIDLPEAQFDLDTPNDYRKLKNLQ